MSTRLEIYQTYADTFDIINNKKVNMLKTNNQKVLSVYQVLSLKMTACSSHSNETIVEEQKGKQ